MQVPVEDMTRLGEEEPPQDDLGGPGPRRASIWPAVEERVFSLIRSHRSTIVFTNSRRSAERLCARLNELAAEELQAAADEGPDAVAPPTAGRRWAYPGRRRTTTARWPATVVSRADRPGAGAAGRRRGAARSGRCGRHGSRPR